MSTTRQRRRRLPHVSRREATISMIISSPILFAVSYSPLWALVTWASVAIMITCRQAVTTVNGGE